MPGNWSSACSSVVPISPPEPAAPVQVMAPAAELRADLGVLFDEYGVPQTGSAVQAA